MEVVNFTSQLLNPLTWKLGETQSQSWILRRSGKSLVPAGNGTTDHPTHTLGHTFKCFTEMLKRWRLTELLLIMD